jgi:hypothetical protein
VAHDQELGRLVQGKEAAEADGQDPVFSLHHPLSAMF